VSAADNGALGTILLLRNNSEVVLFTFKGGDGHCQPWRRSKAKPTMFCGCFLCHRGCLPPLLLNGVKLAALAIALISFFGLCRVFNHSSTLL